jgi:hypothetical protein
MTHRLVAIALAATLAVAGAASAQTQTGDLKGTVTDQQGLALPGATITLSSPQLISTNTAAVTSDTGGFRFTYLPPGSYRVTAELQGFGTKALDGVLVNVGATTEVAIKLAVGQMNEVVNVTASVPLASVENTQLSLNVRPRDLEALPVQRRAASTLTLAAGVTPNLSALGGSTRGNSYSVDGTYLNEPSTGREEVRQSLEVFQEVQVETAGHSAEYGNAGGALLNVITKSGGNRVSGSATLIYQGEKLLSENHQDSGLSAPPQKTIYENEYAANIGGPVSKNRIWYFGAISYLPSKQQQVDFSEDIITKTLWPMGKATFRLTDTQRASVSVTYNRQTQNYAGASPFIAVSATPASKRESLTTAANWLYSPSSTMTIEARAAYATMPNELISPEKVPNYWDIVTNMVTGGFGDVWNGQTRLLAAGTVTKALAGAGGDHLFKGGVEYGDTNYDRTRVWYPDSYGMTNYTTNGGAPYFAIRYDPPDAGERRNAYSELNAFVQDTWKINRHVVVKPGVRISTIDQKIPVQRNVPSEIAVASWTDVEPRIGVGIDPFGNGSTALRFHYGRYTQAMYVWYDNFNPNREAALYYYNPAPGTFILVLEDKYDPAQNQLDSNLGRSAVNEYLFSADHNLPGRWTASGFFVYRKFERFLTTNAPNWVPLYFPKTTTNLLTNQPITYYDTPATAPSPIYLTTNNPAAERTYKAVSLSAQRRFRGAGLLRGSYTWSEASGTSLQVSSSLSAPSSSFLFWDSPNAAINTRGLLDEDRTHEIKLQAVVPLPWAITFGVNYSGTSGPAYTRYQTITQRLGILQLNLEPRGAQRYDFLNLLGFRFDKQFRIGRGSVGGFFEVSNPFNWDTVTSRVLQQNSTNKDRVLTIQSARYGQIGFKVTF